MQSASEETSTAKKANDDAVKAQNGQDYSRSRADQQTAAANDEAKAKLANTAPVAKVPAATAAQLPQTGEKDAKPGILAGILSLLAGVSLFGFSFEKRKQEK
ncbi:hypothetical protein BTI53_07530 [Lactobacillus delbrueckii subsp. bulgaricus]|nr:hypothetical protein [Lactobacillus delbrueckii subsp. bulgaricus]